MRKGVDSKVKVLRAAGRQGTRFVGDVARATARVPDKIGDRMFDENLSIPTAAMLGVLVGMVGHPLAHQVMEGLGDSALAPIGVVAHWWAVANPVLSVAALAFLDAWDE